MLPDNKPEVAVVVTCATMLWIVPENEVQAEDRAWRWEKMPRVLLNTAVPEASVAQGFSDTWPIFPLFHLLPLYLVLSSAIEEP